MTCEQTGWLSNSAYWRRLLHQATQLHVPLSGSIALTHRCNLSCLHCYVGGAGQHCAAGAPEMSTEEVASVIDAVADAGCLFLLFTGGEPLLRPDFAELYRLARGLGILVNVFTNGTLIDDGLIALFDQLPPRMVEISIYGSNAQTHDRITGVQGSFEATLRGVRLLLAHKVHTGLKTVLMTVNQTEITSIRRLAAELGVGFRFDAAIFPRLDGDASPLQYRVPPEVTVAEDFEDADRRQAWCSFFARYRDVPATDKLYVCSAGSSAFHVDACAQLQPCVLTSRYQYDLRQGTFQQGWQYIGDTIQNVKANPQSPCTNCDKKALCGYCPGFFELETGRNDQPSPYLCAIGQLRYAMLSAEA